MKTLRTIIPAALNQIRQGSTFLAVKNYVNNHGEQSHFGIVFHVDYIKAVKKAVDIWRSYTPLNAIERAARQDLIDSYQMTLRGHNPRALSAHTYQRITDGNQIIRSVKWHDNGKACHFWGFLVHKRIIKRGSYPVDTRGQFTVVRENLIGKTPLTNFRQFKIVEGRFGSIGVEHLSLTEKDLLRTLS